MNGPSAVEHYRRIDVRSGELVDCVPEFCRMSLKPGIGAGWFEKFWKDVFGSDRDSVYVHDRAMKPPRYYLEYLRRLDPDLVDVVEFNRYVKSVDPEEKSEDRLLVREQVARGKLSLTSTANKKQSRWRLQKRSQLAMRLSSPQTQPIAGSNCLETSVLRQTTATGCAPNAFTLKVAALPMKVVEPP